ncbi:MULTISPECIES: dihydroorotase [unclassified Sporosarcina]|uniref:dihydroorotase n=1 Tax=unclassified Sporosarcina TaxID=2647733 RepID=UPI000C172A99|nr:MULTISPECIES: dihydroorotase [unclassified Sporosarcina]PID00107.1 dihydroorotase [Sporosarcina sp. P29]PID06789.1 dihydroorotase [Sporosarcina sp. P30]PID09984.1 dihydroorotase [Sporosarcina sp. P31]PID13563.1 dihydroorotase [Sporosarcina sp. P32b]
MNTLIQQVQMVNEEGKIVETDIKIADGKITEIGNQLATDGYEVIEGKGLLVSPGFIDVHVHLREPGGEHKETIETGTHSAAKGGYTTICPMPNTRPVPDTIENLEKVNTLIKDNAKIRVLPYASITIREAGKERTNLSELKEHGAFAFTDDGVGVQEAGMMYEAMQDAAKIDMAIVAHCEDNTLIYGGAMHEGKRNKELGLPGIPSIAESVHIARDILLAEAAGAHYHVCHVSTKESVRVIRDAKRAGIHVTGEVSPHHLLLTEDDVPGDDADWKMNPPLRAIEDREALREGLMDGTLDCIATDHAPHTADEKAVGFAKAPFGITGFETAFPLLYTNFVKPGYWTLKQLLDWMTVKPAEVFNLPYGKLEVGAEADLVLLDLEKQQKIDRTTFVSKGKNTPFDGVECAGWPVMTIFGGNIVWKDGQ